MIGNKALFSRNVADSYRSRLLRGAVGIQPPAYFGRAVEVDEVREDDVLVDTRCVWQYGHYSRVAELYVLRGAALEDVAVEIFAVDGYVAVFALHDVESVACFDYVFGQLDEVVEVFGYDVARIVRLAAEYVDRIVARYHLRYYGSQLGVIDRLNDVCLCGVALLDFEHKLDVGHCAAVQDVADFVILHSVDGGIATLVVFAAYGVLVSRRALRDVDHVDHLVRILRIDGEAVDFYAVDAWADVGVDDLLEPLFRELRRTHRRNHAGQSGFALLLDFAQTEDYRAAVGIGHRAHILGQLTPPVLFAVEVYAALVLERCVLDNTVVYQPPNIIYGLDFHARSSAVFLFCRIVYVEQLLGRHERTHLGIQNPFFYLAYTTFD